MKRREWLNYKRVCEVMNLTKNTITLSINENDKNTARFEDGGNMMSGTSLEILFGPKILNTLHS